MQASRAYTSWAPQRASTAVHQVARSSRCRPPRWRAVSLVVASHRTTTPNQVPAHRRVKKLAGRPETASGSRCDLPGVPAGLLPGTTHVHRSRQPEPAIPTRRRRAACGRDTVDHCLPRVSGLGPGRLIGVDVFFVISGFLITSVIVDSLEAGNFSFQFHHRQTEWSALRSQLQQTFDCLGGDSASG